MSRPVMMALTLLATSTALMSSWFSVWVLIELMLIVFLANAQMEPETKLKYFVLQTISSLGWLMAVITPAPMGLLFFVMLLLKLGLAPFFFWVPVIYAGSDILSIVVLSTIMKLPGIILMSHYTGAGLLVVMLISVIMGCLGGWGASHIKKLLAWSSVTHTSWLCILTATPAWSVLYFIVYSTILMSFAHLSTTGLTLSPNQTLCLPPGHSLPYSCTWMSLAGLPPLMGFTLKWVSVEVLAATSGLLSACYIVIMAVSLYYYLQAILMTTTTLASLTHPHPPIPTSVMVLTSVNMLGLVVFANLA